MLSNPPEKILIIGPSWVGDMVMAQVLFRHLKARNPRAVIDVVGPKLMSSLLDRMPEVNRHIVLPFKHGILDWRGRIAFAKTLDKDYTQAIVLPNSWKSALIPWFAGIPVRTGWRGEMRFGLLNDARPLDKTRYPLMIERFAALAFPKNATLPSLLMPTLVVHPKTLQEALHKYGLNPDEKPVLGLCPGAQFGSSKQWPPEYYAALAKQAHDKGWQVWIIGGPGEKTLAQEITSGAGVPCVDLTMTTLAEAIDLFSVTHSVVSNDSGLMHIAAGLDRPMVAIYGSTTPSFTPPLSEKAKVLARDLPCRPCFKRECPLGHHQCMRDISPEEVMSEISS